MLLGLETGFIAFVTMFVPGVLLAYALLRRTGLHTFEILTIGFIFGLIAPATLTWIDAYLMPYVHALAFSLPLFEVNALIITIIAALVCWKEGVFKDFSQYISAKAKRAVEERQIKSSERVDTLEMSELRSNLRGFEKAQSILKHHEEEENALKNKQASELTNTSGLSEEEKSRIIELHKKAVEALVSKHVEEERRTLSELEREREKIELKSRSADLSTKRSVPSWVWWVLLLFMIMTFATRMLSVPITPTFFEFDPYFDMLSAEHLLAFGYQPLLSHSAWPVIANGTVMRIQPLMPYLEAYWYSLANYLGPHYTTFNTALMSYVGGVYPPITAALLVFVIFMLLYNEYDAYIGLIGGAFAMAMPILFTTFVSGEQLLEPWGIFSLFFFFAAYMLAVKNMKSTRLAIFAGVAFASTFLGAHYYTVDAGVLTLYIVFQGIISYLRGDLGKDFYKMNATVIIVIAIFLAFYSPYHATLSGRIPSVLGLPITVSGPLFALILIAVIDYLPRILKQYHVLFNKIDFKAKALWLVIIAVIVLALLAFTPLGKPVKGYLSLSTKFTTPSTPLFMTVQEFAPTGLTYNFGAAGLGIIASSMFGVPLFVWIISAAAIILICISIYYRRSNTGIFYLMIAVPLMVAAFSEVKYIPHFGVAYIMLIGIVIGEIAILAGNNFKLKRETDDSISMLIKRAYTEHKDMMYFVFSIALFFFSPIIAMIYLLFILFTHRTEYRNYMWALFAFFIIIEIAGAVLSHPIYGESYSLIEAIGSTSLYYSSPTTACASLSNSNNQIGLDLYCNVVPGHWLAALSWMKQNIGPSGPRVMSWWDYGDWINWFGQTPTVTRGDNAVPTLDFAVAANYVLGPKDNYTPSVMAHFMDTNQTKYLIFDQGLIAKWGALDFLACVNINETSRAFAIAEGKLQNPPVPYALGLSPCELAHDPQYVLVPLPTLIPSIQKPSISEYCSISNSTTQYAYSYLVNNNSLSNQTVCIDLNPTSSGAFKVYYQNGTQMNAYIQAITQSPLGESALQRGGPVYLEYLMVYTPNAPNDTITNAPSEFYTSNFYKGFFFGSLPGFTQVYPTNATGINFVNNTYPIRILALNNYTGQLPPKAAKPSYVVNNYTFP
ncbi:membrane-like protein required for N-linked glycosylation [mine drainage metagenome]|uniref:Membrane-like protein required for N-linked glycosylation n=1 Tax=mine drainage metagenome TaxID=410659 RepID=T0ZRU3_9ZZZZ